MIDSFSGDNSFLSNFYPCSIEYQGIKYPSVEHAYQASKTLDIEKRKWIAGIGTAAKAKHTGKRLEIRDDWVAVRYEVMLRLIRLKFEIPSLRSKLDSTGDQKLVEGNWWGDQYWGVCKGRGLNKLGKILMRVRSENRT